MTKTIKAEDLTNGMRIIDPDGNVAQVSRMRRIDHERGRLDTDLGVHVVRLSERVALAE